MSEQNDKTDKLHLASYYIGIAIVFLTHLYMVFLVEKMDRKEILIHSILNIIGAIAIAYYFMNKEKFISF